MGQGSTFAAIGRAEIASLRIPLPLLHEQRRIVDLLSRAEGILRLRREAQAKAQAIIDYRRANGPFKSVGDLENVPGIGPATLKDIRRDVTVTGTSRPAAAAQPTLAPATLPLASTTTPANPASSAMPRRAPMASR